jgi:hypothetical protein
LAEYAEFARIKLASLAIEDCKGGFIMGIMNSLLSLGHHLPF